MLLFYFANIWTVSLTRTQDEFSKASMEDASLWHLRNRLLDAIQDQSTKGTGWFEIEDPVTVDSIVNTYGSALNRKILNSCASRPHTVMEILAIAKIPQTTGYRKIMSLIKYNFLFAHHAVQRSDGKQTVRYLTSFKEIEFHMSENRELIRVKFQENFLQR